MTTLKITPTDDGPYMVEGDVRILDSSSECGFKRPVVRQATA